MQLHLKLIIFIRRFLNLLLRIKAADPLKEMIGDTPSIHVFIPVAEKDFEVLPRVVKSIYEYSQNPIQEICIITPSPIKLRKKIKGTNIKIIADSDFLKIDIRVLRKRYPDCFGWFIQQLIKLKSISYTSSDYILWIDADTVLNEKITFVKNGVILERLSDEFHFPYFLGLEKLFGFRVPCFRFSRVSHHAIVERKSFLNFQIKHNILNEDDWLKQMENSLDRSSFNSKVKDWHIFGKTSFSEYELNSLILAQSKVLVRKAYWWNESREKLNFSDRNFIHSELGKIGFLSKKLRPPHPYTISFHSWNRKE